MADAADQATLVADAADRTSEELLTRSADEAQQTERAADTEDERLRGLAHAELDQVRAQIAHLMSETAAQLESQQSQVSAELLLLRGGHRARNLDSGSRAGVLGRDDLEGQPGLAGDQRRGRGAARPGSGGGGRAPVDHLC